jgi:hypothetical protein
MPKKDTLDREANLLTSYLVHDKANPTVRKLYRTILHESAAKELSVEDSRLIKVGLKHHYLLPYLDAGLAIMRPDAELRRRLYIMFAILEVQPNYVDKFLPQAKSRLYFLVIGLVGLRAVLKTICGVALFAAIKV